jgi:hypothetical protein
MMTSKKQLAALTATAVMMAASILPASAGNSLWSHNGSTVMWQSAGQQRIVTYYNPRPGLPVSSGTVLFEGTRQGNSMFGTAYVFRNGCAPAPYEVSGRIDPDNQTLVVLYGAAPIRARGGCRVIRYSRNSGNSRLVFRYLQRM